MNQQVSELGALGKVVEKIRGRQVLGENLPPNDSDWGNQTIASQIVKADKLSIRRSEHYGEFICGIIAKEHLERDKDV
jgi:hypothetical protein